MNDNSRMIKNCYIAAGAAVLCFLGLSVFAGIGWESNDDMGIAGCIMASGEGSTVFLQKWLVLFLHGLYDRVPRVNWWLIMSLAAIAAGLFCFVFEVYQKKKRLLATVFSAVILISVYVSAARNMNFTKTAAIAAVGGIALVTDSVFSEKKAKYAVLALGTEMLLLSAAIRIETALMALGFLAATGFTYFIYWWQAEQKKSWKVYVKPSILLLTVALIVLASIPVNQVMLTDSEKEYVEYNLARSNVQDFVSEYPLWEEASGQYEAIGISENDYKAFTGWLHEDPEVFGTQTLRKIGTLRKTAEKSIKKAIAQTLEAAMNNRLFAVSVVLMLLVTAFYSLSSVKYNISKCAFLNAFLFSVLLFLMYYGRLPERVLYSAVVLNISCFIILPEYYVESDMKRNAEKVVRFLQKPVNIAIIAFGIVVILGVARKALLAAAAVIMLYVFSILTLRGGLEKAENFLTRIGKKFPSSILMTVFGVFLLVYFMVIPEKMETPFDSHEQEAAKRAECLDIIDRERENVYLVPVCMPAGQSWGSWTCGPHDYCPNKFELGGWGARRPYNVLQLDKYGISNPMKALVERNDTYSFDDPEFNTPVITTFLQEHYDENTTVSRIRKLGDYYLIKYQKRIPDSELNEIDENCKVRELSIRVAEGKLQFFAGVSGIPDGAERFYCNITNDKGNSTYQLGKQNEGLSAVL